MKISTLFHNFVRLAIGMLLAGAVMMLSPTVHAQGCSGDLNGDGRIDGADLATLLVNWGTCPATVSSVSPAQGSVLGGTVITLTGTSLAATSAVTVGGAPCTNLQVLSATQLRATTPPGASGPAAVGITTPAGTSLAPTPFTYVVQSVASIIPSGGLYQGGTPITITGQYLAGTTSVTIGGVPATNVVVVNSTTVTAVTPAGSLGAVDVVVTGAKGSVTVPSGFTYLSVMVPEWATLIEAVPDPAVVTSATLRNAISATGYAWRVRDNTAQIEMLLVPPGTFSMGCTLGSIGYQCYSVEQPVHTVTLSGAFYVAKYEVTQAQWQAKMGFNPSAFQGDADSPARPVEQVSWNTIQGFLTGTGFRLPTEAEWEYACRASTATPFHSGPGFPNGTTDDDLASQIAWWSGNSGGRTQIAGSKAPNALGLHDMLGNVWEWCSDWYGLYSAAAQTNPTGPASGSFRLLRGGSCGSPTGSVRSSSRDGGELGLASPVVGFRVARNP